MFKHFNSFNNRNSRVRFVFSTNDFPVAVVATGSDVTAALWIIQLMELLLKIHRVNGRFRASGAGRESSSKSDFILF